MVGRLSHVSVKAVDTLQELLKSKSDVAKLGAARAILEHATKLRESEELDARLSALEAMAAQEEQRQWSGPRAG